MAEAEITNTFGIVRTLFAVLDLKMNQNNTIVLAKKEKASTTNANNPIFQFYFSSITLVLQ